MKDKSEKYWFSFIIVIDNKWKVQKYRNTKCNEIEENY